MKTKCIKCGDELGDKDAGLVCDACLKDEDTPVWTTCDNCGREFKTDVTDYETLLDSCPHCGHSEDINV